MSNPCFRCGKERIVSRVITEIVNNSPITYTETVCPDPACQEILERELKQQKDRREELVIQRAIDFKARLADRKREKRTELY